jgi:hypothetical protein
MPRPMFEELVMQTIEEMVEESFIALLKAFKERNKAHMVSPPQVNHCRAPPEQI